MGSWRNYFNTAIAVSKSCYGSPLSRQSTCVNFKYIRHYSPAYEGDGKTHAVLINDDTSSLMIRSYSTVGFTLNNKITMIGPIAIFPNCVLSWNVSSIHDINEESLSLFLKLEPKLDILVLGLPEMPKGDRKALLGIIQLVRKHNIQVEILRAEIACPTFNFLHAEQRFVGAGIIPPLHVDGTDATAMGQAGQFGVIREN